LINKLFYYENWINFWEWMLPLQPKLTFMVGASAPFNERFCGDDAEGGTRTPTSCLIRPSNVRVYQFHHFGSWKAINIIASAHLYQNPSSLPLLLVLLFVQAMFELLVEKLVPAAIEMESP
jgi:hypothetical protein